MYKGLEDTVPTAYLDPENRMEMAFTHTEVWDIRARARKLQQLLKWEEEGAVVERWVENCAQSNKPLRLALGRHLGLMWQRELGRQSDIMQGKSEFANKWQPPAQICKRRIGSTAMMDPSALPWMQFPSGANS